MIKKLIIKLLFLVFITASFGAEFRQTAFQTCHLGLNFIKNTNRNTFHRYWQPENGIECSMSSPFYYGNLRMGLQYMPFTGKIVPKSSFKSLYCYLSWEKEFLITSHCCLALGAHCGFYRMHFSQDYPDMDVDLAHEQEFCAGFNSNLGFPLSDKWRLNLTCTYMKIYTYKRIYHLILGTGFSREFNVPQWLQSFLE